MGQLEFDGRDLKLNGFKIPHKFWGMSAVLDFDVMTENNWMDVILGVFSRLDTSTERGKRFFLPHQAEILPEIATDSSSFNPGRMLFKYYELILKLGLVSIFGDLSGNVPRGTASKLLAKRRGVFRKALESLADISIPIDWGPIAWDTSDIDAYIKRAVAEALVEIHNSI